MFFGKSIYRNNKIESMLSNIDKIIVVCPAWPKIYKEAGKIKATQTNQLKYSFTIVL